MYNYADSDYKCPVLIIIIPPPPFPVQAHQSWISVNRKNTNFEDARSAWKIFPLFSADQPSGILNTFHLKKKKKIM